MKYQQGLYSLDTELDKTALAVTGKIPEWLSGVLIRNGPAKFEAGKSKYRHWFDGAAMLHKFSFAAGKVEYMNRFVQSRSFQYEQKKGKIRFANFATDPCYTLFGRIFARFFPKVTDNPVINITRLGDRFLALTETPLPIEFDLENLQTLGAFAYADDIRGQTTTAHPHFSFASRELFNYMLKMSHPRSTYCVYSQLEGSNRREQIGTFSTKEPSYIHSFGLSENLLVFIEAPFVLRPLDIFRNGKPIAEHFRWEPERGTRFVVMDRHSGKIVATAQGDALFCFHHVNAFEQDDTVVVDIVAYRDATIVDYLYMENLRHGDGCIPTGELRRYRIPIGKDNSDFVDYELLSEEPLELPRIDYKKCNTRDYRYVYGVGMRSDGNFLNQLVKIDLRDCSNRVWHQQNCYPGEPIFVAIPGEGKEDDGLILSVVLNAEGKNSFLLVLDASSFQEIARAEVPHVIPFGFHGEYVANKTDNGDG